MIKIERHKNMQVFADVFILHIPVICYVDPESSKIREFPGCKVYLVVPDKELFCIKEPLSEYIAFLFYDEMKEVGIAGPVIDMVMAQIKEITDFETVIGSSAPWSAPPDSFFHSFPALNVKTATLLSDDRFSKHITPEMNNIKVSFTLANVIIRLNDELRWTREEIADWLDGLHADGIIDLNAKVSVDE